MTHINGLRVASYDPNGNMTTRTESATYAQTFDVENRLTDVNGVRFVYDADGGMVKKVEGSKTTTYVGNYFEKEQALVFVPNTQRSFGANWKIEDFALPGGKTRRYYFFGGQRVAVRENNAAPQWIHGDHLGSASITTDLTGVKAGEMRYKPFGEYRVDMGDARGNKRFQGSERVSSIELDSMGARFYSAGFGRFVSADTIVPGAGNPQSFNRYSFVLNNPLKLTDPSGHAVCRTYEDCEDEGSTPSGKNGWNSYIQKLANNKTFIDDWFNNVFEKGLAIWTSPAAQAYSQSPYHRAELRDETPQMAFAIASAVSGVKAVSMLASGVKWAIGEAGVACALSQVCNSIANWFNEVSSVNSRNNQQNAIGATGKMGENALKQLGGRSQVYFPTSLGGRVVDQLVNGHAHESKVGYATLTTDIANQVLKDVELLRTGQVNSVTWHFFRSPVTGLSGPSQPLFDMLQKNNINVLIH